jgi:hypothetical protein
LHEGTVTDTGRLSVLFGTSGAWSSNRLARRPFLPLFARNRKQHFTLPRNSLAAPLCGSGRSALLTGAFLCC